MNISYYSKEREAMVEELISRGYWWYMAEGQNGQWMPPTISRFDRTPEQQAEFAKLATRNCGCYRDFYYNAEITLRDIS